MLARRSCRRFLVTCSIKIYIRAFRNRPEGYGSLKVLSAPVELRKNCRGLSRSTFLEPRTSFFFKIGKEKRSQISVHTWQVFRSTIHLEHIMLHS